MDLIHTDAERKDLGVLDASKLDMAYGDEENDFEATVNRDDHCCEYGDFLYVENEEYGGMIRKMKVNTKKSEITYGGPTWHGIMEGKVICPDPGQDYLILNGEANRVLQRIIEKIDLTGLFAASVENSGIQIVAYQMDRYIGAYTGVKKMLKEFDAKLRIRWERQKVILSAELRKDYSQDEEFDTSQIDFTIEKNYRPVNHLICMGQGDLRKRAVIHLFTDENGGVQPYTKRNPPLEDADYILDESQKVMRGEQEVTEVYDYTGAEITYNYVLLTAQPGDWAQNCEAYFKIGESQDYTEVEKEEVTIYELQRFAPYDWAVNYANYFIKSGDGYVGVSPTTAYIVQTARPSDWEYGYEEYYEKSGAAYKRVSGISTIQYIRQTSQPKDWASNYSNYYNWYHDGVAGEYKRVDGADREKYDVQTQRPTDWNTSFGSYYQKKKAGGYENVTKTKAGKTPAWKAKTYYTRYQYKVAPAWNAEARYTEREVISTPAWRDGLYYTRHDSAAPTWEGNRYYTEKEVIQAPRWTRGAYFRRLEDRYAVMVAKGIERFEEAHKAEELSIDLQETEQTYDIGDLVGATEEVTGIRTVQEVVKKIIRMEENSIQIEYKVN